MNDEHAARLADLIRSPFAALLVGAMPEPAVIVGPDGPSLGGFAAIGQVIRADRWRLGQPTSGCVLHSEHASFIRAPP